MNSRSILLCLAFLCCGCIALGQEPSAPGARPATVMPSVLTVPPEAQPSPHFSAEAATDAYLAQIPAEATARSNAYFEGGDWLILWDFLVGAIVLILVLQLGWSAAMRNFAERITRFQPLQTLIYWAEFFVVTFFLGFPLTVYESFLRERKYGLATQTFGPWMSDQIKALVVSIVLGGIIVMLLFGVVRKDLLATGVKDVMTPRSMAAPLFGNQANP